MKKYGVAGVGPDKKHPDEAVDKLDRVLSWVDQAVGQGV